MTCQELWKRAHPMPLKLHFLQATSEICLAGVAPGPSSSTLYLYLPSGVLTKWCSYPGGVLTQWCSYQWCSYPGGVLTSVWQKATNYFYERTPDQWITARDLPCRGVLQARSAPRRHCKRPRSSSPSDHLEHTDAYASRRCARPRLLTAPPASLSGTRGDRASCDLRAGSPTSDRARALVLAAPC